MDKTRTNSETVNGGEAPPAKPAGALRAGRLDDNYRALGIAVSLMMADPSFGSLPFGHWSRILAGQIRRRHYLIAADGTGPCGFLGWAFTTEAHAERWLAGTGELKFEDSTAGDCVLINAWMAKSDAVHRFLLSEFRGVARGKKTVYAKRFYKDGRMRPLKLAVNVFVNGHLAGR